MVSSARSWGDGNGKGLLEAIGRWTMMSLPTKDLANSENLDVSILVKSPIEKIPFSLCAVDVIDSRRTISATIINGAEDQTTASKEHRY